MIAALANWVFSGATNGYYSFVQVMGSDSQICSNCVVGRDNDPDHLHACRYGVMETAFLGNVDPTEPNHNGVYQANNLDNDFVVKMVVNGVDL